MSERLDDPTFEDYGIGGDTGDYPSQDSTDGYDAGNDNTSGSPSNSSNGDTFQTTMNTGTNRFQFSLPQLTFAHALNKKYPGIVGQDYLNNGYNYVRNTYAIDLSSPNQSNGAGQAAGDGQPSTDEGGVSNEPRLNTTSLSPGLLNKFDQEQNSEWWDEQRNADQTQHPQDQQQSVPPLDYKSHPDYLKALEKVQGENRFTFNGREYFRHGGATYHAQNIIPNVGKRLSPEEAEALDNERARRQMDLPVEKTDGPFGPISAGLATTGVSLAGGATLGAAALSGARSLLKDSIFGFMK